MSIGFAQSWRAAPEAADTPDAPVAPHRQTVFRSLVLAAIIPLSVFAAAAAFLEAESQRNLARAEVAATLARVADRVTVALQNEVQIAQALAALPSLDRPELDRFYRSAQRIAPHRPLWETVSIADTSGEQIMNILRQLGDRLGPVSDRAGFERAIRTQQPVIGDLGPVGPVSGKRLVSISVPIIRDGEVMNVLVVGLSPAEIERILMRAGAPKSWIGSIVDGAGNVVANGTGRGRQASEAVRSAIASAPSGAYRSHTPTGVEVETLYKRLDATNGWTVHFSIRSEKLNGPVSRSSIILAGSCVVCLLLAAVLAHSIARDLEARRREAEQLAALTLAESQAERVQLLKRLAQAQENEQRRIARELHDQVGQSLAGLSLGLKSLETQLGADAHLRERLVWLESLTGEISRDIHRAAADLRPVALDDLGLPGALTALADDLSLRHSILFEVQAIGLEARLDPEVENTAFRVVQEAFTNVLKHSGATTASAVLERRKESLRIVVEDDGRGARQEGGADAWGGKLGLSSIRERLATLGGSLRTETAAGEGFVLFIEIPLAAERTSA